MFCLESTEVCLKEVRCFQFPKSLKKAAPTLFSKKSFVFFSYISYTTTPKALYLLTISGVG